MSDRESIDDRSEARSETDYVKALTEKEALDLTDSEKEVLRDLYDKAVATVERAIRPPKIRLPALPPREESLRAADELVE